MKIKTLRESTTFPKYHYFSFCCICNYVHVQFGNKLSIYLWISECTDTKLLVSAAANDVDCDIWSLSMRETFNCCPVVTTSRSVIACNICCPLKWEII